MAVITPPLNAGMEVAHRALARVSRSVRGFGPVRCREEPRSILLERVSISSERRLPVSRQGAGKTFVYRLTAQEDPVVADPEPPAGRPLQGITSRPSIDRAYEFWVGDGADYCA